MRMRDEDYMKIKTISKTLKERFNAWALTISDPKLREVVMSSGIITGGSIVSMLLKEEVNDVDIYLKDHDSCLAVTQYYANMFSKDEVDVRDINGRISIRVAPVMAYNGNEEAADESPDTVGDEKHEPIFFSSNAITLTGKIQVICRFYGEPEEIHRYYDFAHCTCYWKSWDNELVTPTLALQCILTKELRYVGSKYPLCSLIRMRKFISRGWTINAGQILKMVMQLHDLDLRGPEVLQDQLVGVDSAYFAQVITKMAESGKSTMDTAYICEIIDRIF